MDKEFQNTVVLVTGAGKGTGRGVAEAFAARGAMVAANDVTPINLDETVRRIQSAGGQTKAYIVDIAKKMPVQALLQSIVEDWGHLDILVNCAEVAPRFTVLEMDDWDWQRTLDVNLTGAFLLTQSAGRLMKEQGSGVIIHLGIHTRMLEAKSAYFASKSGLHAFVDKARLELAEHGVQLHHVVAQENRDFIKTILSLSKPKQSHRL